MKTKTLRGLLIVCILLIFTSVILMVIFFVKWVQSGTAVQIDPMDQVAIAEMMKYTKLSIVFFCVTFVPFIPMVIILRKMKTKEIQN